MDAADFKRQFLPCHRKLFRIALRLMGNAQDAEDMVQETYLKLWDKRGQLADVANAEAYSVVLLKHLCCDALRRRQPEEDAQSSAELNVAATDNIVVEVEMRDEANQLQRLIRQLPGPQRQVVTLRDVDECSFEEIEKATGLNAGHIRVLLSRARKKIREQFNAIVNYGTE